MRLIDADHLRKWIIANWHSGWHHKTVDDILDQIDREDTYIEDADIVDAEPIRHGHWIPSSHEEPITFKCSVCGLGYDDEETGCPIYYEWLYCPDCGAKMDEVEE